MKAPPFQTRRGQSRNVKAVVSDDGHHVNDAELDEGARSASHKMVDASRYSGGRPGKDSMNEVSGERTATRNDGPSPRLGISR